MTITLELVFSITLLLAVLISGYTHRSILSTAVLFLSVGLVLGSEPVGVLDINATDSLVVGLVECALFAVLFTDGMRVGARDLASAWRLPGRALLLGMPLTMLFTCVLAHGLIGLSWLQAAILGAALSPTDPVFAAAIVGRQEVPLRLRRLLNIESGLNDGLALPIVVALLHIASSDQPHFLRLTGEIVGGIALGISLPWIVLRLEGSRFFGASEDYQPLNGFAIGLTVFLLAQATHLNEFLAAFAAGVTIASVSPPARDAFHRFGSLLAEVLKLAALLVFGALMSLELLAKTTFSEVLFVVGMLIFVRAISLLLALFRSGLGKREWWTAAWFGPKGFASVVYGLLILRSGVDGSERMLHIIGLVVATSIVVHSSTDVLIAKWFDEEDEISSS